MLLNSAPPIKRNSPAYLKKEYLRLQSLQIYPKAYNSLTYTL